MSPSTVFGAGGGTVLGRPSMFTADSGTLLETGSCPGSESGRSPLPDFGPALPTVRCFDSRAGAKGAISAEPQPRSSFLATAGWILLSPSRERQ